MLFLFWNNLDKNTRTMRNYEISKGTLMGNANNNLLFHLGTRLDQIIVAQLRTRSNNLKGHLCCMKII